MEYAVEEYTEYVFILKCMDNFNYFIFPQNLQHR